MSKLQGVKEIGGYFELELHLGGDGHLYNGSYFNSGSSALEFYIKKNNLAKFYLPGYICASVLRLIIRTGVEVQFYEVDQQLNPILDESVFVKEPSIQVLIVNYFGIKDELVFKYDKFANRIIWDFCHALFCSPPQNSCTFYSPRKFVGIPDGGILIESSKFDFDLKQRLKRSESYKGFLHLIKRLEKGAKFGYEDYKNNEKRLEKEKLKRISKFSENILESLNYEIIKNSRKENFNELHKNLSKINNLNIFENIVKGPMVYPLKLHENEAKELRKKLIEYKIYNAKYWPIQDLANKTESNIKLSESILALPIDQRYGRDEMIHISELILDLYKKG